MKHKHDDHSPRHEGDPTDGPYHHHHHKHRHGGRAFDYGELRLLVLAMTAEQPRHGYELMRAIEERMNGTYSPSPGVIYPTLAWLEDMGYAQAEEGGGRKRFSITREGEAFLIANRVAADELLSRQGSGGRHEGVPVSVVRGMENLKLALRLRLRNGPINQATAEAIAAALDAAAQAVERS